MPLPDWKEEFETGIDFIDYEHRRLVELINRICDDSIHAASADTVADGLGELYAQICAHFALEERLMREEKYQRYEVHKADHEKLLDEIRSMMDAYEEGLCETCKKTLEECLTAWFYKHFRTQDAHFEASRP
jgi:hemerythrin